MMMVMMMMRNKKKVMRIGIPALLIDILLAAALDEGPKKKVIVPSGCYFYANSHTKSHHPGAGGMHDAELLPRLQRAFDKVKRESRKKNENLNEATAV